jgi:hypothetical protein
VPSADLGHMQRHIQLRANSDAIGLKLI